jgi:hypothetical protein
LASDYKEPVVKLMPDVIKPSDIDGMAALIAAEHTAMRKLKGERDTEFVKRIVAAYLNAVGALGIDAIREN